MNIVLYDTISSGHHDIYMLIISKILLENNHNIYLFSPSEDNIKLWINNNCLNIDNFKFIKIRNIKRIKFINDKYSEILHKLRNLFFFKRNIRKIKYKKMKKIDFVFFPYADSILCGRKGICKTGDFFIKYKWSGLFMTVGHERILPGYLKYGSLRFVKYSKKSSSIAIYDKYLIDKVKELSGKKTIHFPDFADTSEPDLNNSLIKEILLNSKGRKIISLTGSIANRKNIINLIKIVNKYNEDNAYIVITGKLHEKDFNSNEIEIINNAKQNKNKFYFHFDRIENESIFNAIISISHILFLAYINFTQSSNLMTKASYFKKPVIVDKKYYMGDVCREYKLGLTVNSENIDEIKKAVELLLDDNEYERINNNAEYERHYNDNSIDKLKEVMKKIIEE